MVHDTLIIVSTTFRWWKGQELLKQVHERKNVLVGGSWRIGKDLWIFQNKQSTSQPSFLKTDGIDSQVSFNHK